MGDRVRAAASRAELVVHEVARAELIYDEVGIPATELRLPDAGVSDADIARWLELAPRYGLRVVGPPIPEAEA